MKYLAAFFLTCTACTKEPDSVIIECRRGHHEIEREVSEVGMPEIVERSKFICDEALPLARWKGTLYELGPKWTGTIK